jgi:hypothetical protein
VCHEWPPVVAAAPPVAAVGRATLWRGHAQR